MEDSTVISTKREQGVSGNKQHGGDNLPLLHLELELETNLNTFSMFLILGAITI